MGYQTSSLPEATEYRMERLSLNYWLMLTLYRNHWIARRMVDMPAEDMTRAWPVLSSELPPDEIERFNRIIDSTFTPSRVCQALKWARLYGGAGALIVLRGHDEQLDQPLDLDDVAPGSYLGLIPFDRWVGVQPDGEISSDIERPEDYNLPEYYMVSPTQGSNLFRVHCSRILRFMGPSVPEPENGAQSYWGISVLELAWEPLRMHDNALWSMLQLLFRSQIISQKNPALAQLLSGVGISNDALQQFYSTMQAQNELLSNQSMLVLGEDGEMGSIQYTFGGLAEVIAQFQMETAGAADMTVTRLFGRTITGLGQSNDADEKFYEDKIAQYQLSQLDPQLQKLYKVVAMSAWGEVPDDFSWKYPSVRVLTETEKAELVERATAPIIAARNADIISQRTAAMELHQLSETTGVFSNITDEDIDAASNSIEPEAEPNPKEEEEFNRPNPRRQEKMLAEGAEDSQP